MEWADATGSLSPLPANVRASQKAMAVFGLLSIVSASGLWLHMSYRLLRWKVKDTNWRGREQVRITSRADNVDLAMGLPESAYRIAKGLPPQHQLARDEPPRENSGATEMQRSFSTRQSSKASNPLLILIHNLILADILLSACFLESIAWLREDSILVGSAYCHAQGWLISVGCMASALFLASMALHTYLATIHGYQPRGGLVMVNVAVGWILALSMTALPQLISRQNKVDLWGRTSLWCWISREHYLLRLPIYIPGFACLIAAVILHTLTFWGLHKEQRSSRFMPPSLQRLDRNNSRSSSQRAHQSRLRPSGHHPAFLVYPFIFTLCAMPLSVGTVFGISESSTTYMGIAGPLVALTGLLDTVLWGITMLCSDDQTIIQTGLDRFTLMSEGPRRTFGNMVWVQAGVRGGGDGQGGSQRQASSKKAPGKGWWVLGSDSGSDSREQIRVVDETCRVVHVSTETSVVVEPESWKSSDDGSLELCHLKPQPLRDLHNEEQIGVRQR
ncbi:unnamed protein product [Discula destructiva]